MLNATDRVDCENPNRVDVASGRWPGLGLDSCRRVKYRSLERLVNFLLPRSDAVGKYARAVT